MNYTDRIATLADIVLDSARTLLDPGSASAQGRSTARARAHAKLTQALTAMVSMAQATEAYALAIEESALDEITDDAPEGAPEGAGELALPSSLGPSPAAINAGGEPNYAKYT